jgi:hypothetical protein
VLKFQLNKLAFQQHNNCTVRIASKISGGDNVGNTYFNQSGGRSGGRRQAPRFGKG